MYIYKFLKRALSGIITASVIMTSMVIPQIAFAANNAPVISVTFDGNSGGYKLNGSAELAAGRSGNALSLDGSADTYAQLTAGDEAIKALNGDYSISVWYMAKTLDTWARVYDLGSGTNDYIFFTPHADSSKPRYAIKSGTEQSVDSQTASLTDTWHNATVVCSNGVVSFYFDGLNTGSAVTITHKPANLAGYANMYLGKSQFEGDAYFNGMIDDFLVYDRALTESEVRTLAAEAYINKQKQKVYENNCYTIDTHFYDGDTEIFSYKLPDEELYISNKSASDGHAEYTIHNLQSAEAELSNITAYVAQYDSKGVLVAVKPEKYRKVEGQTPDTRTISFDYTKSDKEVTTKIFVWNDMTPITIKAVTEKSVTVVASVENDTLTEGTVTASVYAVSKSGTETKLKDIDAVTLSSLESADLKCKIPSEDIPDGTLKLVTKVSAAGKSYNTAELFTGVKSPVAAPADSGSTTNGAHDPSIVKFPGDDTYYVYSSHHLIFTSKDLINWKKYDFTNLTTNPDYTENGNKPNAGKPKIISKTFDFIYNNIDQNVNGTYWAPDVIYRPDDTEHPYWMYISVSCGLGGMNSAVGLIKSDSPLFWAKDGANVVDEGVVFATKAGYVTNAIDANIYTDTDGTNYYIWGSFWGGIQAAKLTADGRVAGVDYTNDTKIMDTCKTTGTSVFTQSTNGTAGPEGAWMINHGDYRYMFTSYGWLGSNYNTRVARAPLSQKFSDNMKTQLKDANGVVMGTQKEVNTDDVTKEKITGYKLIGSYRLGDGAMTMTHDDGSNGYYYARKNGDAHVYYGPGHNSVINVGDETFYVSHTRKDAIEGAATLQVRKMLFTSDGWPVVSPVTYAGEVEQALPKEMLLGTYDLASVGQTKMEGNKIYTGKNPNRNYDLPVISSKVTLNADGTMINASGALGTWTFDNDHTITLKFTKNGDESKDEFYKANDVMTMYALYGYDKDEREPVIALTGTDQKHITQFAKKSISNEVLKTDPVTVAMPDSVNLTKSTGGNPELGFDTSGNRIYAGDPAATVIGDTVYLIAGHDTSSNESYRMPEWVAYSSKNMTDWKYEGPVMNAKDVSWRNDDYSAWASQMTEYGGKYYLYYCTHEKTTNRKSIGVAVADSPTGPYKDIDKPLVSGEFTTPETSNYNDIDPTVFIDTDENGTEHRYLAWGNGKYYVCELNEDMTSIKDLDGDGEIIMHKDILERQIKSLPSGHWFTEAPWLYRRKDADGNYYGKYYLFYAQNWREEMAYATADNPLGRYDFKQILMPPTATSNTNHPSVIDFNGKTYFIYHNGALPHGSGFRRSVCIQELQFDDEGNVYPLTETSIGLDGTASVIKTRDNKYLGHSAFRNPSPDAGYPISVPVNIQNSENEYTTAWELEEPQYVPSGGNKADYVSIQSADKPGLYIASTGSTVTLTQNAGGTDAEAAAMTFKTVKALDGGDGVSFMSVSDPNRYLTVLGASLTLSYGTDAANASFTTAGATAEPTSVIDIAPTEPDADPEEDITNDLNSAAAKTIMSITTAAQPANTSYAGVNLYIGIRSSGADSSTYWAIESASGVDNTPALVMQSGRFSRDNRMPKMQLATPTIPNGYTVTGSFMVKLGEGGGLFYGDSTDYQGTADITDKLSTSAWSTVKVTIKNDNDTYIRKIYINDVEIGTDYIYSFPVFSAKPASNDNDKLKVYIDNISITTVDADGNKPVISAPDPTSKFEFENNLTDSVTNAAGSTVGAKCSLAAASQTAAYAAGHSGSAVSFTGANSDGVKLGKIITDSKYTVSFWFKANTVPQTYSAALFIDADGSQAKWVSAPFGWQSNGNMMVWSNDGNYIDLVSTKSISANEWHQATITANGGTANLYIDGVNAASGNIANVITAASDTYLAVNYWDTPFNGLIDDLYVYNGRTLNASQVKALYDETK